MSTFHKTSLAALIGFTSPLAFAHGDTPVFLPESHAPAGVMAEHLHRESEWMLGYRLMRNEYSSLQRGSDKVSSAELASAGYSMMPASMSMEMHMLDLMYAVSDDLTLMLMPQYMSMDMSMEMIDTSNMGNMEGMSGTEDMHGDHQVDSHSHEVSGIGDTLIGGLFRIADTASYRLHGTLALSAPTGSVEEKNADDSFVHYGMQLGSGTWDLLPSLTWSGARDTLSWGAQLSARLPMQSENDSGFALGERYGATAWSAWRAADWASLSARLEYAKEGDINGHYNGAHNHSSPADLQENYGGEFASYALGVNLVAQEGALAGVRLGLEWVGELSAHYNGFQLAREDGLNMNLSYAF